MRTIITLALFLVIGFAGSRGFVRRATRRLPFGFFVTGMEFFVLGLLAGPRALGLVGASALDDLRPIVFLSLGWIGLLFGIELSWEHLRRVSPSIIRALVIDAVIVFSALFAVSWGLLHLLAVTPDSSSAMTVAALIGVAGAMGTPTVLSIVAHRRSAWGTTASTMAMVTTLSPLLPLLLYGVGVAWGRPGSLGLHGVGAGLLWWLFTNAVGVALGFVMVLFTHDRTSDDEMLLVIMGTVLLVAGVAHYLGLSSLYTSLVMGFIVGNFSRRRDQIFRELHVVEKTLFVGFIFLAGALTALPSTGLLIVVAAGVVVRAAAKILVSARVLSVGRAAGLTMIPQGAMALAVVVEAAITHGDDFTPVLGAVALAVIVNDAAGYSATRYALRAARGDGVDS